MQSTLGEFQETSSQEAFALQNSKLLKVNLQQITIQAKLGSMVAYQGDVSFEHAGSGGMSQLVKKAVTGEGASLMKISGTGEAFLADQAQDIHLIKLENDQITCNGANLLAFDAGIDWDIKREKGVGHDGRRPVQHGALRAPAGWRSSPTARPCCCRPATQPTYADPSAAITWASSVQTSIKTDVNLKTLTGRGSGETVQMAFSGPGWVLVQPSEGRVQAAAGGGGGGLLSNLTG